MLSESKPGKFGSWRELAAFALVALVADVLLFVLFRSLWFLIF